MIWGVRMGGIEKETGGICTICKVCFSSRDCCFLDQRMFVGVVFVVRLRMYQIPRRHPIL